MLSKNLKQYLNTQAKSEARIYVKALLKIELTLFSREIYLLALLSGRVGQKREENWGESIIRPICLLLSLLKQNYLLQRLSFIVLTVLDVTVGNTNHSRNICR